MCAGLGEVSNLEFLTTPLVTLPPTCRSWSPTGRYSTLASLLRETCCCATSQPSTWGNQRGARSYYLGHQTSLVNIMGPRSIFPPLFTPSIYFLLLLSVAASIIFLPLCLILCKHQGRRD